MKGSEKLEATYKIAGKRRKVFSYLDRFQQSKSEWQEKGVGNYQFLYGVCISKTSYNYECRGTQSTESSFTLQAVLPNALVGKILRAGLTQMSA